MLIFLILFSYSFQQCPKISGMFLSPLHLPFVETAHNLHWEKIFLTSKRELELLTVNLCFCAQKNIWRELTTTIYRIVSQNRETLLFHHCIIFFFLSHSELFSSLGMLVDLNYWIGSVIQDKGSLITWVSSQEENYQFLLQSALRIR